jgi:hypothetical protein
MPVILSTEMLRQKDHEFETILGYIVRPSLRERERERERNTF